MDPSNSVPLPNPQDQYLAFYWHLLERWWRTILLCTFLGPILTALVSIVLLPKSYRAQADIKPLPANNLSDTGGWVFQQIYGTTEQSGMEHSKEYIATMESFSFAKWVVRHDPGVYTMLFAKAEGQRFQAHPDTKSEWKAYRTISQNFKCYFDNSAGLLRLSYVAHDPEIARRMLTVLLNDLISVVRDRDIASYTAQIKSLQAMADKTSDDLLRADLYAIIAKRIEQLSTADASAQVAFRIIEAPYVPPVVYRPRPLLYAAASAVVVPIALFAMLVFFERSRAFIAENSVKHQGPPANGLDYSPSPLKVPQTGPNPQPPA